MKLHNYPSRCNGYGEYTCVCVHFAHVMGVYVQSIISGLCSPLETISLSHLPLVRTLHFLTLIHHPLHLSRFSRPRASYLPHRLLDLQH